jgi:putative heme-binding domain-containing protein
LLAYQKDATREAALNALLEIPHVSATDVYLAALGNANPTTRDRARKVLEPFKESALPAVRSRIETMRPIEIAEIKRLYADRPDLTLVAREKTVPTVNDYTNAALNNKGDIERGRRIFHDQSGVACIKCHTVSGQGNAVGPDMTSIGAQFPRTALIEHILDPSKSVREGYQQVLIETSDDESFAGLIKSETAESLTILTAQATLQSIPKSKITARHNSSLSLMPDGLHLGLSVTEFADLIAYLESLRSAK